MDPSEFNPFDYGGYLYGMFFACACIIGAFALAHGGKFVKGFEVPLACFALVGGYMWWTGDTFDYLFTWL